MTVPLAQRGPQLVGVYVTVLVLCTTFLGLRLYVRTFLIKRLGWDDYLAVAAWAFLVCFFAFAITGAAHGTGQHISDLPVTEFPIALKFWWFCEPFYVLVNMSIKASIALTLLRLVVKQWQRWLIYTVLLVTELYSAAFFFIFIFQCRPSSYFWSRWQGDVNGECMSTNIVVDSVYIYSAITCAGDWVYAVLPFFLVRNLQLSPRTKLAVGAILAMGSIASIATVVRFPYIRFLGDTKDFLYTTTDIALWSITETGLGIIAASAATLRPLFKDILGTRSGGSHTMPLTPQYQGRYRLKSDKPSKKGYTQGMDNVPSDGSDNLNNDKAHIRITHSVSVV